MEDAESRVSFEHRKKSRLLGLKVANFDVQYRFLAELIHFCHHDAAAEMTY